MSTILSVATAVVIFCCCCCCSGTRAANCTGVTLPSNCTCSNDTDDDLPVKIECLSAGLTSLPPDLPPGDHIRIEQNSIVVVDKVPYGRSVRFLYLRWNGIFLIQDGAFSDLINLETLALGFNEISSVRREMFQGLTKLKTLTLIGNPLFVLKANTFEGTMLPQLENVDLDNCQLVDFKDGAVNGLTNLMFLTLSHNRLSRFPVLGCSAGQLGNLTTLDVSHNEISAIEYGGSCNFPSLKYLILNNNKIRALNATFCAPSVASVEFVRLKSNNLISIDVDAFNGCPNLTFLDISRNSLVSLDNRTLRWHTMKSVMVGANPWHCGCDNMWLLTETAVKEHNTASEVRCASPTIFKNLSVFSVYDAVITECVPSSQSSIVLIVISVICALIALSIIAVVVYFVARKRRLSYPVIGITAPRSGSSIYRRMSTGNEVIFDYTSTVVQNDNSQNKPVWNEMSTIGGNNNSQRA